MVVRIDKTDRELRTDSSMIRHDSPMPCGRDPAIPCCPIPMSCVPDPDPVRLFDRSVISSIQNAINFTINTRKHGVDPENNLQKVTKVNSTLTG
jgi:hypothetical protein